MSSPAGAHQLKSCVAVLAALFLSAASARAAVIASGNSGDFYSTVSAGLDDDGGSPASLLGETNLSPGAFDQANPFLRTSLSMSPARGAQKAFPLPYLASDGSASRPTNFFLRDGLATLTGSFLVTEVTEDYVIGRLAVSVNGGEPQSFTTFLPGQRPILTAPVEETPAAQDSAIARTLSSNTGRYPLAAIPEPSAFWLGLTGMLLLGRRRR